MTVRICLWSGPRNISTATMRSFESRGDCAVWDEPFYGYYLKETGILHPGREETLAAWPTDPEDIMGRCASDAPNGMPLFFQKHMCQHMLPELDLYFTSHCRHIFLIRDPAEVAASFFATTNAVRAQDLGSERQNFLYEEIADITQRDWPIVEGADVLANPEGMMRALCAAIDIEYRPSMLSWPPGRRETDGPWAPWWYARVEASTGFAPPRPSPHTLPAKLAPVVEACRPSYLALKTRKIAPV